MTLTDALRIAGAEAPAKASVTRSIDRVAGPDESDLEGAAVYVEDAAHAAALGQKRFGLCLVSPAVVEKMDKANGVVALAANPRQSFAVLSAALHKPRELNAAGGIAAPKKIHQSARVHATAIVADGVEIGEGVEIGPYALIGPGVVIGAQSAIAERASVWCAIIGSKVRIAAGTSIGGQGFGFAVGPAGLSRIPQLGRVVLGDHVEIGANCCIDRGSLGDTSIGAGTKIDNLVQIGHNARLGQNCILAAQVGISGSTVLGEGVQCGGQAGIADHLTIGDGARIAAKAGVIGDIPAGEVWAGYPARPRMIWLREAAAMARAARRKKKASDNGD
jgi:UDP-3-O-[3-hydroxymyristoyl] glucosamine N-acyltransferase